MDGSAHMKWTEEELHDLEWLLNSFSPRRDEQEQEMVLYFKRKIHRALGGVMAVSTVFQEGKTQIPVDVRKMLGLEDGRRLVWSVDLHGNVVVSRGAEG